MKTTHLLAALAALGLAACSKEAPPPAAPPKAKAEAAAPAAVPMPPAAPSAAPASSAQDAKAAEPKK